MYLWTRSILPLTGRKLWNLFTLWEVGNEVRLFRLDEGLNYSGGRCKYIQIEKEKTIFFMNDSDDITYDYLLIFWKREAGGKLKV